MKPLYAGIENSFVIHTVEFKTANVHDSEKFDELLQGAEKRVYVNKGCVNKKRRELLQSSRIVPKIKCNQFQFSMAAIADNIRRLFYPYTKTCIVESCDILSKKIHCWSGEAQMMN